MLAKLITLIILIAIPVSAFAHDGNNGWVTMADFQLWTNVYGDSSIRLEPNDGVYNPASCSNPDSYFLDSTLTPATTARIYSMLLALAFTDRSVRVYIHTSSCEVDRPKVLNLLLLPE